MVLLLFLTSYIIQIYVLLHMGVFMYCILQRENVIIACLEFIMALLYIFTADIVCSKAVPNSQWIALTVKVYERTEDVAS